MAERVAYVNLIMRYQPGIANKLRRQAAVASRERIPLDFYWIPALSHAHEHDRLGHSRLTVMPVRGDNDFSVRYHQAAQVNALSRRYAGLVLRYPQFDPVLALLLRDKSRITLEHHAKEVQELRSRGDLRWVTERLFGGAYVSRFAGSSAVTQEILDYELERAGTGRGRVLPNGIDVQDPMVSAPMRSLWDQRAPLNFLFLASTFNRWHGLEEVLDAWQHYGKRRTDMLHVVGRASSAQAHRASTLPNVKLYGVQDNVSIAAMYDRSHVALTSYRLDLKSLNEASTLKVREYLLAGLPVFSGHRDAAFPEDFPFYVNQPEPDFAAMRTFVAEHALTTRTAIRDVAIPYIDAARFTRQLYEFALENGAM